MVHTGRSESSIRRWIRALRNQHQIDLDHTNEQLEQTTPHLRKRNELEFDGTPRQDKHGLPVFDWLLLKSSLEQMFPLEGSQPPSDNLQPPDHDSPDHSPDGGQQNPADSPDTGQPKDDDIQEVKNGGVDDEVKPPSDNSPDSGQNEYISIHKPTWEKTLEQIEESNARDRRKDKQIDEFQKKDRQQTILIAAMAEKLKALPEGIVRRVDTDEEFPDEENEVN